jgi:histidinol dehydrogenase
VNLIEWSSASPGERQQALRRPASSVDVTDAVRDIIATVRRDGDRALKAFTEQFDGITVATLDVTPEEFRDARRAATKEQIAAFERAIGNVERFHRACLPKSTQLEVEPGVRCEQVVRPIASVGLYAPAGTAPLPSAVIMQAIPARIAGCPLRVLCTPPRSDGTAHPAILTAAQLCGIDAVFKVGGAQAIAAMAYGTERVPRVQKIFGPGNVWVTTAKEWVARDRDGAACDLPAGPSEVLVVADNGARADFVASDLLAQLEHDTLAQAILVSDSHALIRRVEEQIRRQRRILSRRSILAQSLRLARAILVEDVKSAIEVVNAYAPEHLILQVDDPRRWLPHIHNAGSIFLGAWSPEPIGDYCAGPNHVLPTDGYARTLSGLSVRDFVKTISVQELTPAGLTALGPTAVALAELEGLDAHAQAVRYRLRTALQTVTSRPRRRLRA